MEHCDNELNDSSTIQSDPEESLADLSGISFLPANTSQISIGQPVVLTPSRHGGVNPGEGGPSIAKKPRITRPRVQCPKCRKSYASEGYLKRHDLQVHSTATGNNSAGAGSSTSNSQTQPKFQCFKCGAEIIEKNVLKHMKTHGLEELAAVKLPNDEEILTAITEQTPLVLQLLLSSTPHYEGELGNEELRKLAGGVLKVFEAGEDCVALFICSIALSICEMFKHRADVSQPTDIPFMCVEGLNAIFANIDFMMDLAGQLTKILDGELDQSPQSQFLAFTFLNKFITEMSIEIVCWMLRLLRQEPAADPVSPSRKTLRDSMASSVYYAIGSVVSSDMRCHPSTSNSRVDPALFTEGAGTVATYLSNFTKSQNRGGLKICNVRYYRFAKAVILHLRKFAWKNICSGSETSHKEFMSTLCEDAEVMQLWKTVVGEELCTTDSSFNSFEYHTKKITNFLMTGIKNVIINNKLKGGISISHRSGLAGGSKASKA